MMSVAVVTGASSGLGLEIAALLKHRGVQKGYPAHQNHNMEFHQQAFSDGASEMRQCVLRVTGMIYFLSPCNTW